MNIGIDLDEVTFNFLEGYLNLFEKKYGRSVYFEDISSFYLWDVLGITKEQALKLSEEYYNSQEFSNLPLIEQADVNIKKLAEKNNLYFISARPRSVIEKTKLNLDKHFEKLNYGLFFSGDFYNFGSKTKFQICKENNIKLMVEDNLEFALSCAREDIKVVLLDRPWNQWENVSNIIRVKNWGEVVEVINED